MMKKIAIVALAMSAIIPLRVSSKSFVVTYDGVEVENGSTVTTGYTALRTDAAAMITWAPLLEIKAVSGTADVIVEVSSEASGFKICWPRVCQEVVAGTPVVVESTVGETPQNMQIECFRIVMAGAEIGEQEAKVTARDYDGETLSFTLKCVDEDLAGVESVATDCRREEVARFSVDGKRLETPERGINIVRYSDGSVVKESVR